MCLELEEGYLKTDRWYYDYPEIEFIKLTKKYPYIPFLVDDGTGNDKYYRWNPQSQVLEELDANFIFIGCWNQVKEIKYLFPKEVKLAFIVFTDSIISSVCKNRSGLEIIINTVPNELVTRKSRVGSGSIYPNSYAN